MPTYRFIREQMRQDLNAEGGEPCSEMMLNAVCAMVYALATGETDRLFEGMPSDRTREHVRQGLALAQQESAEAIRLVRAETKRLYAEAYRQGLAAHAAEDMVQATLWREFYRSTYGEIREAVHRKLSGVEDAPIPVDEQTMRPICVLLAHLVFDNGSGWTLRLHSTDPQLWNDEGEHALTHMRRRFAREIALLEGETTRLADAAEARGMGDDAVRRMIQARLNREFIDGRPRRINPRHS